MTTTQRTNSAGFPLVDCGRCGGNGRFGPTSVCGGQCFDCAGTGVRIKPGAWTKAWIAYSAALPNRAVVAGSLNVGDKVVSDFGHRKTKENTWDTVTRIEVSPLRCGSSLTGTDEANRIHYYYRTVTLASGTSRTIAEHALVRRQITAAMLPNPADFYPKQAA